MPALNRNILKLAAAAVVLTASLSFSGPAAAQQVYANTTVNLNQRAGPDTRYPVLVVVPQSAPVTLFGCVRNLTWCDGSYRGYRGWFSARYLTIPYRNARLSVASYVRYAYLPTVAFNINSYWDRYYRKRPFYAQLSAFAGGGSVNVAIGSFYQPLARHGRWVELRDRYVWAPRVDRDWRPYTEGRWVYTRRNGWTWVSDEPFGWATYHYGRWAYSRDIGWFWVPGTQWAPAWVAWRRDNDHLAWAPLPPQRNDSFGLSLDISFGNIPNYYWSAVRNEDFQSDNIQNVVIGDNNQVVNIINNSQEVGTVNVVNNVVINNNIDIAYIEQVSGQQVEVRDVALTTTEAEGGKIDGNTLEIYHPEPQALVPTEAPAEVATEEQAAAEATTTGQEAGGAATDENVPPPPATDQVPAEAVSSAPPMDGVAMEGDLATAPPAEAVPEGPAPEGVEACGEGTIRQPDGNCGAPAAEAQAAEELTPETPLADTPPAAAEGQPAAEEPAAPVDTGPCPEGTVRQPDGLCAAPVSEAQPMLPASEPELATEPPPAPQADPAPEPAPAPIEESAPASEPEPAPELTPVPEEYPAPEPAPAPIEEPIPAPEPEPAPEPTPVPEEYPAPEPAPAPIEEPTQAPEQKQQAAPDPTPAPAEALPPPTCPDGQVVDQDGACVAPQ